MSTPSIKFKKRKEFGFWNMVMRIFFPGAVRERTWNTFNKTIWTPGYTPEDIIAHEMVHVVQQKNFFYSVYWWIRYILSKKFRYSQEIVAYRQQYKWILENVAGKKQREEAFKLRLSIAVVLAGPTYNLGKSVNEVAAELENEKYNFK